MALRIRCEKHDVVYVMPLLSEWELWTDVPTCPHCRMEWMEGHKDDWNFPEPYEIFAMGTRLAMECVVEITTNVASDEGMSSYPDSDPLLVGLYREESWQTRIKYFVEEVFWRIQCALQVLLCGEFD